MRDTKITNVNLVVNHFPQHNIYRNTLIEFMKAIKAVEIINVNHVVNHFLKQEF